MGRGTQRVEETLAARFPGARIVRIDRDSARRRGELARTLEGIRRGEGDILVGTQLLAKGHDFPAPHAGRRPERRQRARLDRLPRGRAPVRGAGAGRRARRPARAAGRSADPDALSAPPALRRARAARLRRLRRRRSSRSASGGLPAVRVRSGAARRGAAARNGAATSCASAAASVQPPDEVQVFDPVPHLLTRRAGLERAQLVMQSRSRPALQELSRRAQRQALRSSAARRALAPRRRPDRVRLDIIQCLSWLSTRKPRSSDALRKALAQGSAGVRRRPDRRSSAASKPEHGDFASQRRPAARQAAEDATRASWRESLSAVAAFPDHRRLFETTEIAGPGFINFRLKPGAKTRRRSAASSRPARSFGRAREGKAARRCRSSSFRPTRPGRCTSATAGRRRSATRSPRCSKRRATR